MLRLCQARFQAPSASKIALLAVNLEGEEDVTEHGIEQTSDTAKSQLFYPHFLPSLVTVNSPKPFVQFTNLSEIIFDRAS